jgi:hypothetical protein
MSRAPASRGKTKRRQAAALHTGRYVGALRVSGQAVLKNIYEIGGSTR